MIGCACRPSSLRGNLPSSSSSSSSPTPTSSTRASIRRSSTSHFSNRTFIPVPIHPLSITTTTRSLLISCVSGHGRRKNQQQSVYETILHSSTLPLSGNDDHGGSGNNNNNNNNNNNGGWSWNSFDSEGWGWWWNGEGSSFSHHPLILFFLSSRASQDTIFGRNNKVLVFLLSALGLGYFYNFQVGSALARTAASAPPYDGNDNDKEEKGNEEEEGTLWEVRGGKWIKLIPDVFKDVFVVAPGTSSSSSSPLDNLWLQCRDIFIRLMLPEGFPESVTSDYLDYSLWRGVQGVASQISGVLATQSLLYAVGLGKGAIPTAAAINWVLKDGIGYLSKIFLSKYGRHFDVNPKGWRLFADLLENAAFGMEMLTPAFPQFFVLIGAAAGAGRSAAALIQAATRSCFYAGFAAQRNFAEVIAKGEAQGMVSKFIGIMLGIALANWIGSSTSLALASFSVITWVHMYTNLKSYQCIQLRTLNPYRASLVFSEYLLSGQIPSVKEVNGEEPLFPAVPYINLNPGYKVQSAGLSVEAKDAAAEIDRRLQLGSKLSNVVNSKQDALSLFDLYKNEGYILTEHEGKYCVILKESCSQQDMLKSVFHVNYLYWLESNAGIKWRNTIDECRPGGRLHISLDYVQREFNHVKYDGEVSGWTADGLIARPLPNRIRPGYAATTLAS